jgi:hypothetical protein
MGEPTSSPRFVLRNLRLSVRLTLAVFLLSVGVGYFSALVQLHFQQASGGNPLPTLDDVVERFSGIPHFMSGKPDNGPQQPEKPVSQLERLIMGPEQGLPFNGAGSMGKVFFEKMKNAQKDWPNREGERKLLQTWINAEPPQRKEAYEADAFPLPKDLAEAPITAKYKEGETVKVRSILEDRCYKCHEVEGQQGKVKLSSIEDLEKYMKIPKPVAEEGAAPAKSTKQITVERLAQSTHAHLLSFCTLYLLTGVIFALTSYPGWIRGFLAPLVLVAQVADIGCWWLARLDGVGPYFALTIPITGAIVGVGLMLQIVLSLFNMFGWKGKSVLLVMFLGVAVGGVILYQKVFDPVLAAEKEAIRKANEKK